jgi:lipoyl(octanoyl) transferase
VNGTESIEVVRLPGLTPYADAWGLQRLIADRRAEGESGDVLLLLQHPPTITYNPGSSGRENIVATPSELARRGVVVEATDRGGNVTYHGPGQLVGYPIVHLDAWGRDVGRFLRTLEAMLIDVGNELGVPMGRVAGRTGAWTLDGQRKLAAIGVKVGRWVTTHGFALNVITDLDEWSVIVPCGIRDAAVGSLQIELARLGLAPPSMERVEDAVTAAVARRFEGLRILVDRWRAQSHLVAEPPAVDTRT